jgi:hypothetical protein
LVKCAYLILNYLDVCADQVVRVWKKNINQSIWSRSEKLEEVSPSRSKEHHGRLQGYTVDSMFLLVHFVQKADKQFRR